jgi:Tol biopolymer transport system component
VNDYRGVSLSADGRTIATVESEWHSNIWIVPLGGGAARQITSAVRGNIGGGGLAWTPDGRLVYAAPVGVNNQLWIMDADGRGARQLTNAKGFAALPNVSSDGTWVYYNGGDDRSTIIKMALAGGDPRSITPGPRDQSAFMPSDSNRSLIC